jgi:mono/diheme cytochrome c family protein
MSDPHQNLDYHEPADISRVHSAVQRETKNLATGQEPLSLFSLMLTGLALILAGSFFSKYGGELAFLPPAGSTNLAAILDTRPKSAGDVVLDPEEQFKLIGSKTYGACLACHQANGEGLPGVFPPLAKSDYVLGSTERLGLIILNGVAGPLKVNGVSYNNAMPSQASLSDEEIAAVLTHIRKTWGNDAGKVYPEGIKALREKNKSRPPGPMTEAELLAIPEDAMLEEPVATSTDVPAAPAPAN